MKVIFDAHEAVLTKPGSSVTWPVSLSSLPTSSPDGPSVASTRGKGSWPPGCLSSYSVGEFIAEPFPSTGLATRAVSQKAGAPGQGTMTVIPAGVVAPDIAASAGPASSSPIRADTSRSGRSRPASTSASISP